MLDLAERVIGKYSDKLSGTSAATLAAIAQVESGGDPRAYRFEEHLGEGSAGLTQVLLSTAKWLASEMGYDDLGVPAGEEDLFDPVKAMYFGAAYLSYLASYKGQERSEEFVVRGYNGGPNGINIDATAHYWSKYQRAKQLILDLKAKAGTSDTDGFEKSKGYVEVAKGDTLYAIAKRTGFALADIERANPGINPHLLSIGQTIVIPTR